MPDLWVFGIGQLPLHAERGGRGGRQRKEKDIQSHLVGKAVARITFRLTNPLPFDARGKLTKIGGITCLHEGHCGHV